LEAYGLVVNEFLIERLFERLNQIDRGCLSDFHVVLLPDFFVDHFLFFGDIEKVFSEIKNLYLSGGGNLPGVEQRIHQGGNAANSALALTRLGVRTHLICRTDKLGLHLMRYFLERFGVDLSGVKTDGKLAMTTVMEFGGEHVNAMIGDVGSVSDFTFDMLDERDLETISGSDMVCVLCWNLNKHGTMLAEDVFGFAKRHGVKTFFDSGDPSSRKEEEISMLIKNVLEKNVLDIFGLNENELCYYSDYHDLDAEDEKKVIDAVVSLKKKIYPRVDLHTRCLSCTAVGKDVVVVPALRLLKVYRSTGAGDVWNAGDIFGELLGFDDNERLFFSNVLAGCYISSVDPIPPSLEEVIDFLKKMKKKL